MRNSLPSNSLVQRLLGRYDRVLAALEVHAVGVGRVRRVADADASHLPPKPVESWSKRYFLSDYQCTERVSQSTSTYIPLLPQYVSGTAPPAFSRTLQARVAGVGAYVDPRAVGDAQGPARAVAQEQVLHRDVPAPDEVHERRPRPVHARLRGDLLLRLLRALPPGLALPRDDAVPLRCRASWAMDVLYYSGPEHYFKNAEHYLSHTKPQ